MNLGKVAAATSMSALLLISQSAPLLGNPTGGAVVAGAATIGSAGRTLTINQSSNLAIINWQTFSIASGETTKFFVPTSSSATLNRVLGGNPSAIYGTLSSNGQLFLINPSGVVVGPGGRIDTSGFLGSTLNVSDDAFLKGGSLNFAGTSTASIDNQGSINASSGDVYLIANQIGNEGSITAPQGNVGLAAAASVLYQPAGDQHLFIQSSPSGTTRATGVTNAGTIKAASAELRAAGGNAYALAINNTGSIAATGYKKIDGQVYLTADTGAIANAGSIHATGKSRGGAVSLTSQTGTITNSGLIDVSATGAGGQGGSVLLKSAGGTVVHSGKILAKGGHGGAGGTAVISGAGMNFTGTVDLTAAHGRTGNLTLDPTTLEVVTGGSGTISGGENDPSSTTVDPSAVVTALGMANVNLNADTNITVTNGITWTTGNTLTLSTTASGSTIVINAPITGTAGGLEIATAGENDQVTTGANGNIHVSSFVLTNGYWNQNSATLPTFAADSDFEINGGTFLRVTGGDGLSANTAYQITDVYGLQGLASPSKNLLTVDAELVNDISAGGTSNWRSARGFAPIGTYDGSDSSDSNTFSGNFNGMSHTITGLTIDDPTAPDAGLFGDTAQGSTIQNVNLTNYNITGGAYVGSLVGVNNSSITSVTASGAVTGQSYVGGLVGITAGQIASSSSAGIITGNSSAYGVGGIAGEEQQNSSSTTSILSSFSTATVTSGGNSAAIGGLVGVNVGGSISDSYTRQTVTGGSGSDEVGGLVGDNDGGTITNTYSDSTVSGGSQVGGLVGLAQGGTVSISYGAGSVTGTATVGGLIGEADSGNVEDCYYNTGDGASGGIGDSGSSAITYNGTSASSVTGLSGAQAKLQSNFDSAWNFATTWTTEGNTVQPVLIGVGEGAGQSGTGTITGTDLLSGTVFTNSGITVAADASITFVFDGTTVGTTSADPSGDFSFSVPAADVGAGLLLIDATHKGDTYFQSGSSANSFSGLDLWGSTLRIVADTASNAALKAAITGYSGSGVNYAVSGGALTTTTGVNLNILSGYTIDGNLTAAGTLTSGSGANLTGSVVATLQGTAVTLSGAMDETGALTVKSTTGAIIVQDLGSSTTPATVGGMTLTATGPVLLDDSYITLTSGNFSATGTGYASTSNANGEANGVNVFDSTILTQGGGITLTGTAGYTNPGSGIEAGNGVAIGTDGTTPVELGATGSGNITIQGTFNQNVTSTTFFAGVEIYDDNPGQTPGTVLSVQNGAISIIGNVLKGGGSSTTEAGGSIVGVNIENGVALQALGTGSISLTGTTTAATSQASGSAFQFIEGVGIQGALSTAGGNVTINGAAGTINTSASTLTGSDNSDTPATLGVVVNSNGSISAGSGAVVSVTGTGGSVVTTGAYTGSSSGVSFESGSSLSLGTNGTLTIIGTGGAVNAGNGANSGDAETRGVHFGGSVTAMTGGSISVTGTGGGLDISHATAPTDSNIPTSEGITVGGSGDGGSINASGTTSITLTGVGGNVTGSASDAIGGSVGVNVGNDHSELDEITTDGGLLKITGTAGSAPSLGIGVVIHGFNGTTALLSSNTGTIQIMGTGGSGYAGTGTLTGNYVPNDGVGIFDSAALDSASGAISIIGVGGAHSGGVVVYQLNDSVLETAPTEPTVSAGGALTVTSTTGNVTLDANTSGGSTTITSTGALTIANTAGNVALLTGDLTATAAGAIDLNGEVDASGAATIKSTGGDITLGASGLVTDTGTASVLSLVAGTSAANGHNFINDSESGADAVQANNGAVFYIYSAGPTNDVFNGITAANTVYSATYPAGSPPAGNTEFFYSAYSAPPTTDTLSGFAYSDSGSTISADDLVTLLFDGTVVGTATTDNTGAFTFTVSSTDVGGGLVLTDETVHGDTYFQSGSPATAFTGADIWGSTLRVIADTASNAALKTAIGSLPTAANNIYYSVSSGNLSTTTGENIDIVSNYNVDGNLTASGAFSTEDNALLTGSANATLKGAVVIMTGNLNRTGSLTIESTAGTIQINDLGSSDTPAVVNGLTLTAVGGPVILDTSYLQLGGGSLTMSGTGSGSMLDGVDLFGTTVDAQGGNIMITGQAGYDAESTDAGVGISIDSSSLLTSGTGKITLVGNGSAGTSAAGSVDTFMAGTLVDNSTLTAGAGAISISGSVTRGNTSDSIEGLEVDDSTVQTTADGGSITLTGNTVGSIATDSYNDGADIYCNGTNSISTQNGAGIHITGNAGAVILDSESDGPEAAYGVTLGSNLSTTGTAPIVITATGGAVTDHSSGGSIQSTGLDIYNAAGTGSITEEDDIPFNAEVISTVAGAITLTGTGGASDNGGFGVGMFAYAGSPVYIQSASGNISITGTGGAGNPGTAAESATYEPNIGVAIGDAINIASTSGNVTITGTGRNAPGIKLGTFAGYLNGTTDLDEEPTTPSVTAGATLKLVSFSGGIESDADLGATTTTITSPGTLSIGNSQGGTAISTDTLTATASGSITLDNAIVTDGTATISTSGGDITFGPAFSISDTGAGHNLTIAAGTSLPHSHYILNQSDAGADAVQVTNGAQFDLFSADPTNDQFNGITVPENNVVFNANYPANNLPEGNGELFYVVNAGDVGPNPPGSGNTGGGGGGGGTNSPTDPTGVASMEDGSGSNIVPPQIVPQNGDVQPPPGALPGFNGDTPPPYGYAGNGNTGQTGGPTGGLASSSGNGSDVGAGDETVASKEGVGNNNNPDASNELNLALGPAVHSALNLALSSVGEYTDTTTGDDGRAGSTGGAGGSGGETPVGSGQVVVIGNSGGVKQIPPSQAPPPLQKALGNSVLNGLPGH